MTQPERRLLASDGNRVFAHATPRPQRRLPLRHLPSFCLHGEALGKGCALRGRGHWNLKRNSARTA